MMALSKLSVARDLISEAVAELEQFFAGSPEGEQLLAKIRAAREAMASTDEAL
jgi:hypothetical protein